MWIGSPGSEPEALRALLQSHPDTRGVRIATAIPEATVRISLGRGSAAADLLLFGSSRTNRAVVAIEAKADEPFDKTVYQQYNSALNKTKKVVRIETLTEALFKRSFVTVDPEIANLRYQLLIRALGALIEADNRSAHCAVFVVHEFLSDGLNPRKLHRNREDLIAFVGSLPGLERKHLKPGQLLGPVTLESSSALERQIPLYIGKIQTRV